MAKTIEQRIRKYGFSRLAEALGVSRQAVQNWGSEVPPRRVLDVERHTKIPRTELRPDIYPPEEPIFSD